MKQDITLKEQLQGKFNELPIPGRAAHDWQILENALNVAMPVTAFSFLIQWKAWLAKKVLWLYLMGLSIGGGAALIVYNPQQPNTSAVRAVAGDTVIAKKDTVARKHKTSPPVASKDTNFRNRKTLPLKASKDTIARKQKTPPPLAPKDTIVRKQKTLSVVPKNTISRKYKKFPPPYAPKDTTVRKHKTSPPKLVQDSTARKIKKA